MLFFEIYPIFHIKKFHSESEIAQQQWPMRLGPNILKQSYSRSLKPFSFNLCQILFTMNGVRI